MCPEPTNRTSRRFEIRARHFPNRRMYRGERRFSAAFRRESRGGFRVCVRTGLSPLGGWIAFLFYPRLAPWAAFLRRFAARNRPSCSTANQRIEFSRTHFSPVANRRSTAAPHSSPEGAPPLSRLLRQGGDFEFTRSTTAHARRRARADMISPP